MQVPTSIPSRQNAEVALQRLESRLQRQTRARLEAENLLEAKSLALYRVNESLQKLTDELESEVAKQTRQLTVALEQAHAATKAKDAFLANLSHEVRTPLNAIIGLTQLLGRTQLEPEQENYLNLLGASASNLMVLLNDILDFSKIESGKLSFHIVHFDFLNWISQACGTYALQAEAKNLKFKLDLDAQLPQFVEGDPQRLGQVLSNLLTNALKFTAQGQIEVGASLDHDQVGLLAQQVRLRIAVKDTGIGVPIEQQNQVFEPFMQADSSITRNYGGTGLGLTICTRLVKQMGGEFSLLSQPAEGSQFSFTVVLKLAKSSDSTPLQKPSERQNPMLNLRILVAEDQAINQLLMGKLLGRFGAHVVFADNGLIAVDKFKSDVFDLIFMDMQMPVMGGFEATEKIRQYQIGTGKYTPIIALTAHAMPGDKQRCLDAGMDAYVSKPVNEADLLQAVDDALKAKV